MIEPVTLLRLLYNRWFSTQHVMDIEAQRNDGWPAGVNLCGTSNGLFVLDNASCTHLLPRPASNVFTEILTVVSIFF